MKAIYRLLKPFFIKHYLADEHKHVSMRSMLYAYSDTKARKYYSFETKVSLPFERWAKLSEFLSLYGRGLSSKGMDELLDAGQKQLEKFLTESEKVKACAAISTIFNEMKWRQDMIIPIELFYNIFAVQIVREDENPEQYDNSIQMQKVEEMKEIVKTYGSGFFLHRQELKILFDFTTRSETEWQQYFQAMIESQAVMEQTLKILSPSDTSKKPE